MKKKAILQIPPIKPDIKGEIIGVAKIVTIQKEKHLLIDFYREKTHVLRTVLTEEGFANYKVEARVWNEKIIENEYEVDTKNAKLSQKTLDEIFMFCRKKTPDYIGGRGEIIRYEEAINRKKRERAERKKQDELQERIHDMPDLPEDFDKWAESQTGTNILFYERTGRKAEITCSGCGKTCTGYIKPSESYERFMSERILKIIPSQGKYGTCEFCGRTGIYKHRKRQNLIEAGTNVHIIQPFRTGIVNRMFEVKKYMRSGGTTEFVKTEIIRAFLMPEKKGVIKDYHKYNHYTGNGFWDYKDLAGLAHIGLQAGSLYPGSLKVVEKSHLKYSGLREYIQSKEYDTMANKLINPVAYLETYSEHRYLEMLVKLNLKGITERILRHYGCQYINENGNNATEILGIDKKSIRTLIKHKGDIGVLRILQVLQHAGINIKAEEEKELIDLRVDADKLGEAAEYITPRKIINYIHKAAGVEQGEVCHMALSQLRHTATLYLDYLHMRKETGYDMSNTIYLFPKNLRDAHKKMVEESIKKEADARIKHVNKKYENIKKSYRKLRKRYYYESEGYEIRPAKDAGEIVMEGRILHHCVGGDGYLEKHNKGTSYILMLRPTGNKKEPYITVEISDEKIIQWYGANDEKPDETNMKAWLNDYVKWLKKEVKSDIRVSVAV